MSERSGSGTKRNDCFLNIGIILGSFLFVFMLCFIFSEQAGLWNAGLNDQFFRLRYGLFGKERISPFLTHVVVNDESYTELDVKLWDRGFYSTILRALARAGASAIASDFVFQEQGDNAGDAALVRATREAGNIYYPYIFRSGRIPGTGNNSFENILTDNTLTKNIWHPVILKEGRPFSGEAVETVFPELAASCRGMGHINAFPDPDGINRRFPLIYKYKDGYVPSLIFHALCDYLHVTPEQIEVSFGNCILLKNAYMGKNIPRDIKIPVDERGMVVINYPARWEDSFLQFPVQNIIKAAADEEQLHQLYDVMDGTLVLFSDISMRVNDYGTGIFDPLYPLSGIHLTIANMVLTGNFLWDYNMVSIILMYSIGIALLCVFSIKWRSAVFYLFAGGVFLLFVLCTISEFIIFRTLPLMLPFSLGFFISLLSLSIFRFTREKQEKNLVRLQIDLKKRFFENVTHELKTPLTLIQGPLDIVSQRLLRAGPDVLKEQLSIIQRNSERLGDLVDQILDLSKIEETTMKLNAERSNIVPMIDNIINKLTPLAVEKKVCPVFDPGERQQYLYVDHEKFERIISNLLAMEIRATPPKGKVIISLNKKREKTGTRYIEIRCKNKIKIFSPSRFTEKKNMMMNTEIGMLLVKELVALHHGSIQVKYNPLKGREIVLCFPCGRDHLQPYEIMKTSEIESILHEETHAEGSGKRFEPLSKKPLLKQTILVIDNDRDMRSYIRTILSPSYTVIEAIDAGEGMEKAGVHEPVLIICASFLPVIDGYECIRQLREKEIYASTPVILVTGSPEEEEEEISVDTSSIPDDVITTPFHPVELSVKIKNLLSIYSSRYKPRSSVRGEIPVQKKAILYPASPLLIAADASMLEEYSSVLTKHGITNIIRCGHEDTVCTILDRNEITTLVLDLGILHGACGDLLEKIHDLYPELPVIVVTYDSETERAIQCMKQGAFDYLIKPVSSSRLTAVIRQAIEKQTMSRRQDTAEPPRVSPTLVHTEAFSHIVTRNPVMFSIFEELEAFSLSSEPILIAGESGVGKKLFAQAIHSIYKGNNNFIPVNIAGIDDTLFSDTLFGHVKGAFTTAVGLREGLTAKAEDGSLFLDEIGDLELTSQVKLLELIEDHYYYPLGSDKKRISHARIILATNRDLKQKIKEGTFREDLYQRITHKISIPPLRERFDDLPLLLDHFFTISSAFMGKKKPTYPGQLITLLKTYHFPGNVRELEAMVKNAVSLHRGKVLSLKYFRQYIEQQKSTEKHNIGNSREMYSNVFNIKDFPPLKNIEELHIKKALELAEGNMTIAARLLGLSLSALSRRLKKLK
jgi:DNA-binding NtrC family response regulator/signal transduction histidine kinase